MDEQSTISPGWYADGSGAVRWWDGTAWTEHTAPAAPGDREPAGRERATQDVDRSGAPPRRPALPPGASVDNGWTWTTAIVPFAIAPAVFFFDFSGYIRATLSGDPSGLLAYAGYLLGITVLSWGVMAMTVVAAYRDYRRLVGIGVVRPFHWAFAFLGAIVYLIGRHVVLRKVGDTPGWPLWTHIALYAAYLIGMTAWIVWITQRVLNEVLWSYGIAPGVS
ncbi:DUF2510 domain-containing protein [Leucobacter sp. CSA1]|uniref:DUF2510 domain-containing protein n=1 Tax=Leucobacter chromiisoli TaxID=2796471 RepID=A0A934Q6Z9_9MICO|nr:DUF2510 domain-containing protein [Leucobacter chromiisoli]MBK0418525.1 DUF2510 domain-containing protein [Leucobacter chromiisoli]